MICRSETQLRDLLKGSAVAGAWLLAGAEDYLKERYARRIRSLAVAPAFEAFNLKRYDARSMDWADLLADAQALPLMSPSKCICVEELNCEKLTADQFAALEELLGYADESCVLLFVHTAQVDLKRSRSYAKLEKLFDAHGTVAQLDRAGEADIRRYITATLEKCGAAITPELCRLVSQRCSGEMQQIAVETEKLAAYCAGRAVTHADVEAVVCDTVESSIYDLSRAILAGRYERSLAILSDLLYQRVAPTVILMTLSQPFLDLYRAAAARQSGVALPQLVEDFGYQRFRFRAENAMRDAARYPIQLLRESLAVLAEADHRLKSSRAEEEIVLQQAITELFLLLQKAGKAR